MTYANPRLRRVEMKFMLDADLSEQVRDWAIDRLGVDENSASDGSNSYDIHSLYLDTPDYDLYHRTGVIGKAKHRVRRYGSDEMLVLETKRKKNMVVRKNRSAVFESDFAAQVLELSRQSGGSVVASDQSSGEPWCGDWFLKRIAERRLFPATEIAYRRFARTSMVNGENLRLTIDSNMVARSPRGWSVAMPGDVYGDDARSGFRSIGEFEILELKFEKQMPHLFKELLRSFPIPGTRFSKFRTAMKHQLRRTDRAHTGVARPAIPDAAFHRTHATEQMSNA
ncbi:polyphosphate polymerase domain-containing protein [Rhodopirellula sallentina]|uniref:VTC domain protein n=1 Tax=Rhodopirellula sallentina SM41 TaxID=1263870 RepID=M5U782_9BACT|nr:polyphosphate polymerase domain-containing protein [Rhodopirellula sallentina]EMI57342.1 VTC domain protein [Rhodopirellula sallentina SM41]